MAIPAALLPKVIDGLAALSRNGLRYPVRPTASSPTPAPALGRPYAEKDKKRLGAGQRTYSRC